MYLVWQTKQIEKLLYKQFFTITNEESFYVGSYFNMI